MSIGSYRDEALLASKRFPSFLVPGTYKAEGPFCLLISQTNYQVQSSTRKVISNISSSLHSILIANNTDRLNDPHHN